MNKQQAIDKLKEIDQEHLLNHWDNLPSSYQQLLLSQIEQIDTEILKEQTTLLQHPPSIQSGQIEPYRDYSHSGTEEDYDDGKKVIEAAKVGCLIVAGGQGTRLRFDGPKGMFPVTRIKHKSLFQLFAEKTVAASKQANYPLPLAIMTSPLNDSIIRDFFKENGNFGLLPEQLFFFSQKMLPFLDIDSKMFLENPHTIAVAPDGNGYSLRYFYESQIWQQWKDLGIEYLNFIQIDNPLADPYDPELVGFHKRTEADITIKCILRKEPQEKMGLVVKKEDKTLVIEYTELPLNQRCATGSDGSLKYRCANISLFCLSMNFVRQCAEVNLPLHANFKTAKYINEDGITQRPFEPNAWKFETFIFDYLSQTTKIECLLYPRKDCFAPLKNAEGPDSLGTVQDALQDSDIQIVKKISGCPPPDTPFELAQEFYYPTSYLLDIWKDRPFPNTNYITEGS